MEYTGETYQCYDCNYTWAHEDDACPDCGSSYFTEININKTIKMEKPDGFNKAPKLDQILYDCTGMLVKNHPDIAEAMQKYADQQLISKQRELLISFHAYIDETQGFAPKPLNERRVDNFIKNKLPLQSKEITISIQEYESLRRDSENLNKVDFGN